MVTRSKTRTMTVKRKARLFYASWFAPLEFIANSVNGHNIDWLGRIRFQLLSEVPDMGINGPFRTFRNRRRPWPFQELHAAKDTIRCRGKGYQAG